MNRPFDSRCRKKKCEARRYAGFCASGTSCEAHNVTAINLGRGSPTRLGATYPPAQRAASSLAYLVLLRAEIARFTRTESARLCCSDPHLTVESR